MTPIRPTALALACILSLPALPQTAGGASGVTEHISKTGAGAVADAHNWAPCMTPDGRWIAFHSFAALLPTDTNGLADVYAYDRWNDTLVAVSLNDAGVHGNGHSYFPDISADGRYIAFESGSNNLFGVDTNMMPDVYVRDMVAGTTIRVSNSAGTNIAANSRSDDASISEDGRYVAFRSGASDLGVLDTNLRHDIYRYDLQTGAMVRVSDGPFGESNGNNAHPYISADGSRISWESWADNLIVGDGNGLPDVFVADVGGLPQLVSRTPAGAPANSNSHWGRISADGAYVVFVSFADDIVPGVGAHLSTYRYEVATQQVEAVSVDSAGVPANDASNAATLSADGRYVAFESRATNLAPFHGATWSVFLRDMELGLTWTVGRADGVVGVANDTAGDGIVSADGSIVAFWSRATNLVPGVDVQYQGEIYVRTIHPDPEVYCASSITSAGCQPGISSSGYSSASAAAGFTIDCTDVPNQNPGLLVHGFSGSDAVPFMGSTLCVALPVERGPLLASGGSPPAISDCSGSFSLDMNAFAAGLLGGGPSPALSLVGQQVNAQFWGRDPAGATGVFLSDAIRYLVGP